MATTVLNLSAGDTYSLPVTFTGLSLGDYSEVKAYLRQNMTGNMIEHDVRPDGSNPALGFVDWNPGDIIPGVHTLEFKFKRTSDNRVFTLPCENKISVSVRPVSY